MTDRINAPGNRRRRPAGHRRAWAVGLALVLLMTALSLAGCSKPDPQAMKEGSGHFLRENATPELSEEGVKCVVSEAYYTNGGDLYLKLTMSNGTEQPRRLLTLNVTLKNGEDEQIAKAATDQIDESFILEPGGYGTMNFYISPEYLTLTDDDLDKISYEITTTSDTAEDT